MALLVRDSNLLIANKEDAPPGLSWLRRCSCLFNEPLCMQIKLTLRYGSNFTLQMKEKLIKPFGIEFLISCEKIKLDEFDW